MIINEKGITMKTPKMNAKIADHTSTALELIDNAVMEFMQINSDSKGTFCMLEYQVARSLQIDYYAVKMSMDRLQMQGFIRALIIGDMKTVFSAEELEPFSHTMILADISSGDDTTDDVQDFEYVSGRCLLERLIEKVQG